MKKHLEEKLTGFGYRARNIVYAAQNGPVNPWRYFGRSMRRSWAYAYFHRLAAVGAIVRVPTPEGCQGTEWYVAATEE